MEPLHEGDPDAVDGWQVVGRLWSSGPITAFKATNGAVSSELQFLQFDAATAEAMREAFHDEVNRVAALGQGRMPSVLASSFGDGHAWIAMEYVPGQNLGDRVASRGPLGLAEWDELAECLLSSLDEVHATGIVHRDVTPASIIFAEGGPRLTGLGVAQVAVDAGMSTAAVFSRALMWLSPEQIEGAQATSDSDLFSAGSTLSFAATGRQPWGPMGTPTAEVIDRIVRSAPDTTGLSYEQLRLISALTAKDSSFRSMNLEVIRVGGPVIEVRTEIPDALPAKSDAVLEPATEPAVSTARALTKAPVAMLSLHPREQQRDLTVRSRRNLTIAGAAAALAVLVLVAFVALGHRTAPDPTSQPGPEPARSSSSAGGESASDAASPAEEPPNYVTRVNYVEDPIPDKTFTNSLEWEFDVCSQDRELAQTRFVSRIALYEVKSGKWSRIAAKAVVLTPGRCKAGQFNITIAAEEVAPDSGQVGKGWLDCVKHRVITPETATFAKSYIDFCVQTRAEVA